MRKTRTLAALILPLLLLAAAVSGAPKEAPTSCRRCGMHLDPANKRFSVTVTAGMEASSFDDIGCAMLWRAGECAMRTSAFDANARVYDFRTGEPVVIEQAFFVRGTGLRTPMGYDIAAFKTGEEAEKLIREKGKGDFFTFNQLCSLKLN